MLFRSNQVMDKYAKTGLLLPDEMPEVELYMDQVVSLLNKELAVYKEKEQNVFTKSMVSNYVKHKVLPKPENKKYNKEHMVILNMIFQLKSNPYLAFAVMLAAGLKGIEENYSLTPPIEEDVFKMTDAQRKANGIGTLPGSLEEAIWEMEKSDLVREALGDHIFTKFIENKKIEWEAYRTQVTRYEIERYLPLL